MEGARPARRRESLAERRQRRAAVDDPQVILDAAARFLETRPRSVTEVRRRLARAGYRPELVQDAIDRLLELGFLDDEAFARTWVESRDRARPRGERAIRDELRLKGIDRATIDVVLEERHEAGGGEADRDAAERLIERNARSLARVADLRQRRARAYALLARNGFDPDVCREVAARVVNVDDSSEAAESR
jgi:regulatory protein